MGIKLELLLVLLIGATTYVTMTTKLKDETIESTAKTKEIEFTNTTFTEVTTEKREGIAYGTYGVRIGGVLYMENIKYHNDNIKLLLADKGTYKGKEIYLDGNVTVHQKPEYDYYTEHAVYDKEAEVLHVTSPFVACIRKDVMRGDTLVYYMKPKEAFATSVDAVFYTKEDDVVTYRCEDALKTFRKNKKRG